MAATTTETSGPSDAELITAVRTNGSDAGDAYGKLYNRHVGAAYNLARQVSRSGSEADDFVSEAFAKVLDTLRGGGGPETAFRAYLLTALRHLAYDRTRRESKLDLTEDMNEVSELGQPFTDTAVAGLERSLAARAFARLPERWQTVLWHTEVEEQSAAEVGTMLGLSANGVSALAYRAREGLRQAYLQVHLAETSGERCRATVERLGSWTRGGLSKRETAQVEQHLDDCERCRGLAAELADVNGGMRGIIAPMVLGTATAGYLAGATGGGSVALAATGAGAAGGGASLTAGGAGVGPKQWLTAAASITALTVAVGAGLVSGGGTQSNLASGPENNPTQQSPQTTQPPSSGLPNQNPGSQIPPLFPDQPGGQVPGSQLPPGLNLPPELNLGQGPGGFPGAQLPPGLNLPPGAIGPGLQAPRTQVPGSQLPPLSLPGPRQGPGPQAPGGQTPAPQNPNPQNPSPQNPNPQNPSPQNPNPQNPSPQNPSPQNPSPQDPGPQKPDDQQPPENPPGDENPPPAPEPAELSANVDGESTVNTVRTGGSATLKYAVSNSGGSTAEDSTVTFQLPEGLSYDETSGAVATAPAVAPTTPQAVSTTPQAAAGPDCTASGSTVTCQVGDLAPGERAGVTLPVTTAVNDSFPERAANYTVQGEVTASGEEEAVQSSQVVAPPAGLRFVQLQKSNVLLGKDVLKVVNEGDTPAEMSVDFHYSGLANANFDPSCGGVLGTLNLQIAEGSFTCAGTMPANSSTTIGSASVGGLVPSLLGALTGSKVTASNIAFTPEGGHTIHRPVVSTDVQAPQQDDATASNTPEPSTEPSPEPTDSPAPTSAAPEPSPAPEPTSEPAPEPSSAPAPSGPASPKTAQPSQTPAPKPETPEDEPASSAPKSAPAAAPKSTESGQS